MKGVYLGIYTENIWVYFQDISESIYLPGIAELETDDVEDLLPLSAVVVLCPFPHHHLEVLLLGHIYHVYLPHRP